jgi:VHL beta domain
VRAFSQRVLQLVVLIVTTSVVARAQTLPLLTPMTPSATLALESQNGNTSTYIEFVNDSGVGVVVYWINYTGQLVFYAFLAPGQSYVQQTYLTHPWLIYDQATGLPIVGFLPIAQEAEALIKAATTCATTVTNLVGDTIYVSGTVDSTDPGANGAGVTYAFLSSGGELTAATITPGAGDDSYFLPKPFPPYVATQANETITGTPITGASSNSTCSVTATSKPPFFESKAVLSLLSSIYDLIGTTLDVTSEEACKGAGPLAPICAFLSDFASAEYQAEAKAMEDAAADPIDNNFTQILLPQIPTILPINRSDISPDLAYAFDALNRNNAATIGITRALVTTLNRASGASAANNNLWLAIQLAEAKRLEYHLSALLDKEISLLRKADAALEASGIIGTFTITFSDVLSFEQGVASNGLPPDEINALKSLGCNTADIMLITDLAIVQNPNAAAVPITSLLASPAFISALTSAAQSLR